MIATTVMAVVIFVWCGITLVVRGGPVNRVPVTPDLNTKIAYDTEPKSTATPATRTWRCEAQPRWDQAALDGNPETGIADTMKRRRERSRTPAASHRRTRGNRSEAEKNSITGAARPARLDRPLVPVFAAKLRQPGNWLSMVGLIGLFLAFGHSILAMSGEETLAQVYREVESPKMLNFKKAAFVVFVYSLVLTGGISFLAVMLDPRRRAHEVLQRQPHRRPGDVHGWARYVARLLLNGFVVVVGFLILAGAVNTAIIGSNGVLNRVAEDGVMPDWFLKPHRRYGTTYRMLYLVVALQLFTIVLSRRQHGHAGRGLCFRRGLEFRLQGPGDGRAAVQGPHAARVQGAAQFPHRRRGNPLRA